jgi:hypothetical protein
MPYRKSKRRFTFTTSTEPPPVWDRTPTRYGGPCSSPATGGAPLPARLLGRIAVDPLAGVAGVGSPEQEAIERSGTD